MTDPKLIPSLIRLLDEESAHLVEPVLTELINFGPLLEEQLSDLNLDLTSRQKYYLLHLLDHQMVLRLFQQWPSWFLVEDTNKKLEKALGILTQFLHRKGERRLDRVLDGLALAYLNEYKTINYQTLAKYLFQDLGLCGDEEDYYNPQNSDLISVIERKKGIPISLTAVYILVGSRVGVEIQGCQFPGHFLARTEDQGKTVYVDCFSSGQVMTREEIIHFREDLEDCIEEILDEAPSVEMIARRFLANIMRSYQVKEDEDRAHLFVKLFKELEYRMDLNHLKDVTPEDIIGDTEVLYKVGEVVYHQKYGYRGIIVDFDSTCQADDEWYYGNQTQPKKNQPWYHVLVDGSDQVTYVSQSNLEQDTSKEKIEHPLLSYFFTQSSDGTYIRNENPWPEEEE